MTLLAPLFLLGLLGLSVPIVVHLVHRQKPEGHPFPSLMFLRKIPHKAQRRQRIRHWLIFLLRCAAVLLVVLAFARPLLERPPEVLAQLASGRDVVVLLDRSLSMTYRDRWERAQSAVRRVIDGMGPDDRVSIIAFDESAEAANEPSSDPLAVRAALDGVTPGDGGTQFSPAIKLAQRLLDQGSRPRKEVVLVTDFQRSGWNRQDVVRFGDVVTLTPVDLSTPGADNLAVASVTVRQEPTGDRERAQVSARVINPGPTAAEPVLVVFEINGQEVGRRRVAVDAGDAVSVVFEPALVPMIPARAVIRLPEDGLAGDDAFHFVLTPGQAVRVVILEGSTPEPNQSLYLQRALEIGSDPPFRSTVKRMRNFRLSDLDQADVLVLNDAPMPGGTAGAAIRAFVEGGGGLLVILGPDSRRWPEDVAGLLPGVVGARVEPRSGRGGTVTQLDYGHEIFEPFNAPRSGDLASARVFRYRSVDVTEDDSTRVLARYDDGGVAVAERRVGAGRAVVMTTTVDTYWTDLPLQPVYLPLVHQTFRYLADYGRVRPWFTIGAVADLPAYGARMPGGAALADAFGEGDAEIVITDPRRDRRRLPGSSDGLFRVTARGFYDIAADDTDPVILAANVDPVESDLTPVDVQAFLTSLAPDAGSVRAAGVGADLSIEEQEQRQGVWWYLLVAAALVLAIETWLSNRLSRATR